MARTKRIRVFECVGCGARTMWKRMTMPTAGETWYGDCPRCGEFQDHVVWLAKIAATDLRYVRTLGAENGKYGVVDVTDLTEGSAD